MKQTEGPRLPLRMLARCTFRVRTNRAQGSDNVKLMKGNGELHLSRSRLFLELRIEVLISSLFKTGDAPFVIGRKRRIGHER